MLESLSWYDAIAQSGIAISHEEAAQGWPCDMFVWRVAQLQRDERASRIALHWALSAAVNDGSVPSVQKVLRVEESGRRRDIHGTVYGEAAPVPRVRDVLERYVTAADVVAWLEKAGEKPSRHIAAWFAATGAGRTNETGQMARRVLKKDMSPEWTGQRLAERQAELRGAKAPTKRLATESGLDEREVRRRIANWNSEKASPFSPARMSQPTREEAREKTKSPRAKK